MGGFLFRRSFMKKIFIFSDSHIPSRANSQILQKIEFGKYDYIITVGDIVDDNTYFELINQESGFFGVHGNMDDFFIKKKLPAKRVIEIEGIKIGLIHGHQTGMANPKELIKYFDEEIDIMVFGHSHKKYDEKINEIRVVNPGALCDGYFIEMEINKSKYDINFEKLDI
jgi:putative phosphoesterase